MRRVLHPTDFSDTARRAEEHAVALVQEGGGELVLLHVGVETPLYNEGFFGLVEPRRVYEAQRAWAEGALEERAAAIRAGGVAARWLLRAGVPHEQIVKAAAEEGCTLIVMGTHGRRGIDHLLLGSVAERVIRLAPCPVMTVRFSG